MAYLSAGKANMRISFLYFWYPIWTNFPSIMTVVLWKKNFKNNQLEKITTLHWCFSSIFSHEWHLISFLPLPNSLPSILTCEDLNQSQKLASHPKLKICHAMRPQPLSRNLLEIEIRYPITRELYQYNNRNFKHHVHGELSYVLLNGVELWECE